MTTSTADKVRENRLRRIAQRQGYQLSKDRGRNPRASDYGMYAIIDPDRNTIVAGVGATGRYEFDLDEVEAWLKSEEDDLNQVGPTTTSQLTSEQTEELTRLLSPLFGLEGATLAMVNPRGELRLYPIPLLAGSIPVGDQELSATIWKLLRNPYLSYGLYGRRLLPLMRKRDGKLEVVPRLEWWTPHSLHMSFELPTGLAARPLGQQGYMNPGDPDRWQGPRSFCRTCGIALDGISPADMAAKLTEHMLSHVATENSN